MVTQFPTPKYSAPVAPHQDRVNTEMFKAIEILGRKLERAEGERDRLQRRLALIESAASVDEKTGKLYLPVVVDPSSISPPHIIERSAPKWMAATSLLSTTLALIAISMVAFREPQTHLSTQQLAALDALMQPQMAKFENKTWKTITPVEDIAEAPVADATTDTEDDLAARDFLNRKPDGTPADDAEELPAEAELAAMEQTAKPLDFIGPVRPAVTETAAVVTDTATAVVEAPVEVTAPAPVVTAEVAKPEAVKPAPVKTVTTTTTARRIDADATLPAKFVGLEKRAFDGAPEAQHDLATLYASGQMVTQDYKRAAYWFARAADGGIANAHYNIGVMFQQGLGLKRNMASAIDWYKKAAELGHPEAMYNLGIAYIEGVGTERNIDRGVSYFKRAANAGVAQAAFNLGVLYESSFIGGKDLPKALDWYEVAVKEGHQDAAKAVTRLTAQIASNKKDATASASTIEPAAGNDEATSGQGDASQPGDDIPAAASTPDALLKDIQSALIAKGFLPEAADTGLSSVQTQDAIRAFQKKAGIAVDGIATPSLLVEMKKN